MYIYICIMQEIYIYIYIYTFGSPQEKLFGLAAGGAWRKSFSDWRRGALRQIVSDWLLGAHRKDFFGWQLARSPEENVFLLAVRTFLGYLSGISRVSARTLPFSIFLFVPFPQFQIETENNIINQVEKVALSNMQ